VPRLQSVGMVCQFLRWQRRYPIPWLCDLLGPGAVTSFFWRWQVRLPSPFTRADLRVGYVYELAFRQFEVSDTRVFDRPAAGRAFFGGLIRDHLDLGRPDQVSLVFGRNVRLAGPHPTPGALLVLLRARGQSWSVTDEDESAGSALEVLRQASGGQMSLSRTGLTGIIWRRLPRARSPGGNAAACAFSPSWIPITRLSCSPAAAVPDDQRAAGRGRLPQCRDRRHAARSPSWWQPGCWPMRMQHCGLRGALMSLTLVAVYDPV